MGEVYKFRNPGDPESPKKGLRAFCGSFCRELKDYLSKLSKLFTDLRGGKIAPQRIPSGRPVTVGRKSKEYLLRSKVMEAYANQNSRNSLEEINMKDPLEKDYGIGVEYDRKL